MELSIPLKRRGVGNIEVRLMLEGSYYGEAFSESQSV